MTERREHDYYPTPPCAGFALRDWLPRHVRLADHLDPMAGPGLLLQWVCASPQQRHAIELQERFRARLRNGCRSVAIGDAFKLPWQPVHVTTNPSFALAERTVRRGLHHTRQHQRWLCVLVQTSWIQACRRRDLPLPDHLLLLGWRPSYDGSGGTDVRGYAWHVWVPEDERPSTPTVHRLERPIVPPELVQLHRDLALAA